MPPADTEAPNEQQQRDHDTRTRALFELMMAEVRESVGVHAYDGVVQDLSPEGVRAALARVAPARADDPALEHDERHLRAFERAAHTSFGEYQIHRRDPLVHIGNLDLACYDREYAPVQERREARARHLAAWPDGVDGALSSLDQVSAPVATALLGSARGLAEGLHELAADPDDPADDEIVKAALAAHARLVSHLEKQAATGDPDCAVGARALALEMGTVEALEVDLAVLAEQADSERDRLTERLADACARLAPGRPVADVVTELLSDHPDLDGVLAEAREVTAEVLRFTTERGLVPDTDGVCEVNPAPASRSWAMAMMNWAAPEEDDAPSQYYVTPPDPSWPAEEIAQWLTVFSRTTLPAITVHEVAPGHYTHGRSLRRAPTLVRRALHSATFAEGWAHYVEELLIDEGFRRDDPRYEIGVWIEALLRVTRLASAIGIHTGGMTVEESARRFQHDAHLSPKAAESEAARGTFDIGYGRYTWGKLYLRETHRQAEQAWGSGYSHSRFHTALMRLGSPPLGLIGHAITVG